MVVTNAQTAEFLEKRMQIAIPHATVMQLFNEGIATVSDLVKFEKAPCSSMQATYKVLGGRSQILP